MSDKRIIGVDIGGTKISMGIIANGEVVKRHRINTPATAAKEVVLDALVGALHELRADEEVAGIGIGVPGLLDEKEGVVYDLINIPSWDEVYLAKAVREATGLEVYLTNDANCFALGEKCYGQGRRYESFVGITLGTGLGAGFIINGQVHAGLVSAAGELALIPYLKHHYEYYCSGQFFENEFNVSGQQVYERAQQGDPLALGYYEQYGQHVGSLLKSLLQILSPEAILIGGSIKDAFSYFEKSMWKELHTYPYKRVLDRLVVARSEMDDIALLGAAALFQMRSPEMALSV